MKNVQLIEVCRLSLLYAVNAAFYAAQTEINCVRMYVCVCVSLC